MSTVSRAADRIESVPFLTRDDASLLLVLPGLFVFSAFMLFPVLYLLGISFTNAEPANLFAGEGVVAVLTFGDALFVGLENYADVLTDGQFWNSFGVTWLFVATSVTLKIGASLAIALIVTSELVRGKRVLRSLIIFPMGLPPIFTITVWRGIFSSAEFGLMNQLLTAFGASSVAWLSGRWTAFVAYNVTEAWLAYPFMVIITVSALQDVPEELHEAAVVDGAGFLARFAHITLPSIKRPVLFASILTSAASFQQFLIPFVFNQGGPARANELIVVYGYREALSFQQYGRGAAISIIALAFIGAFMWLNVKKGKLADGVND
ncbi:sugar ABC transporter permease [Haloarcula hispanica N601]|uniref:Sugar ABC transporter permease n=3 Tax=Haloarcula hispanica TaxID=51589 RepID=A0A482TDE6_HALHI|nr:MULTISPECIES: sugar ABC transporter permease [Haloarcula]AEM58370.1 ABC-type sugar transport systems permease component [Haloarcula hispanica ATCC 33960]AHB67102.1 sugar ABC transporter permease [Haloarcula hispanica N601]KAA9405982.1 sugar ABC transporter permease [Haloarcula sp. CBA1131]KAA9411010.1 sugar ABC transporter permease [Haloarcula hispanica]KZX47113.1 sugar ABC transporter permease [Haloarcula sp. K1]